MTKSKTKELQNYTKTQPVNEKTLSMKRRVYERNQICCLILSLLPPPLPPPPPHSRRIRGDFARSPSPEPSYLGGNISPISVVGNHSFRLLFTRNTPFSGLFGKSSQDKHPKAEASILDPPPPPPMKILGGGGANISFCPAPPPPNNFDNLTNS